MCIRCARTSLTHCPSLRKGAAAGWVGYAPAWGVAGLFHSRATLRPTPDTALDHVPSGDPRMRWTLAYRLAAELLDVTPVNLDALA